MMRISTAQVFNQNITSVLEKQTANAKILDQLSSGKRLNTAGDDPVAAIGIDNLNQKNALVEQYLKNVDYAKNRLSFSESKLGSAESMTTSIREQLLRRVNGSVSATERQMIADELRGSLQEMLAIANSKDESGNYVFGGNNINGQPFAFNNAGTMVYSGDNGVRTSVIASGVTVGINIPGDSAFMNAPSGLGDYGVNYLASQQGDFRVSSAKITNAASHVPDTYTFNFINNGAGGVNLEVRNSAATLVTSVANFDASNSVSFNGLAVKLEGKPLAGDSFSMAPVSSVSIFDTINQAITLLEAPNQVNTPQGKSQLAQLLNNFDSGVNQLSIARSVAGNSLKSIESYAKGHEEEKVVNTSALSMLEDLDYASAITEFEKQQLALNAVSQVFGRVGSASLFDFI